MSSSIAIAIPRPKKRMEERLGNGDGSVDSNGSSSDSEADRLVGSSAGFAGRYKYAERRSPGDESRIRRPSLMSATYSKAEHTVVNVGDSESPRLITCVKASQGFDWNQEIFLPSYADYIFDDLERRQDPVQEIILTDEEVKNMFPS